MDLSLFNIQHGFSEALVRGLRTGFLKPEDYHKFRVCESVDDIRTVLEGTEYQPSMEGLPNALTPNQIQMACCEQLHNELSFLETQSVGSLYEFIGLIRQERMIENVIRILRGTIAQEAPADLISKIDPVGSFEGISAIPFLDVTMGYDEVYTIVLQDTPIGKYMEHFLKEHRNTAIDEFITNTDLDILKVKLRNLWMEEVHRFCLAQGGSTAEIMSIVLSKEADAASVNSILNCASAGKACPIEIHSTLGSLYPEAVIALSTATNELDVQRVFDKLPAYRDVFDRVKNVYFETTVDTGRVR